MPSSFEKRRTEFGEQLRQLRAAAGYETGKDFAQAIGWNAPKVSKIENGRQTASDDDLDAWLAAVDAPDDVAATLRAMLESIRNAYVTWKEAVRAGHRARQEQSIGREAKAKRIRAYDANMVSGLVQIPEYARHALTKHAAIHGGAQDITEAVQTRMRRQQILYEPGRTIELLTTEAALRHPGAPRDVMVAQLHRLLATVGMPGVRLGIIPMNVELPYPLTTDFWIVDDVVMIETPTAELTIDDPDEVATFDKIADLMWTVAEEGDAARATLLRVLGDLAPAG